MSQISELCDLIVARLSALGSPIAELLQPGLTEQEIHEVQETLRLVFPNSIKEMFKWRNGTKLKNGAAFFPGWTFDTLVESARRYKMLTHDDDGLWKSSLFPIFSASDVSSIGILCERGPMEDAEIWRFEYMLGIEVEFITLEAMLRTILTSYDRGVIFIEDDGSLEMDDDAFESIARDLNPGLKRWNQ